MVFKTLVKYLLFIGFAIIILGCKKDESNPDQTPPPTPITEGGTVSGVYVNYDDGITDSFLISDVSARTTTLGGFSFVRSNDAYEFLFFFPDVNDTGLFYAPYSPYYHFRVIENGDTIPCHTHSFSAHITHFEAFPNYTLISGTYKLTGSKGEPDGPYLMIEDGEFLDIPISNIRSGGNNVIYQGEESPLTNSKVLIMDHMFFSRHEFLNEFIYTTSFGLDGFDNSHSTMSFGHIPSQIALFAKNHTENTVSGRIETTEEVDLDLSFENTQYENFLELEEGQMALVYNFGEEIMHFDSAKYVVSETAFMSDEIRGYKDGSIKVSISVLFDQQGTAVENGHTSMSNNGISFLPNEVDGFSFIGFSSDNSTASFEFGSVMGMQNYKQVSLKGKNIPVGM